MSKLSVIVPCYNEEGVTPLFYKEAIQYIKKCTKTYEIIFVNDGSSDNTLKDLKDIKKKDKNIVILDFSRNFGKEAAMLAGLKESKGDYVVVMDVDLQDPPYLLPSMFKLVSSGEYDCAATRRVTRKGEPPIRSFFARRFYGLINRMVEVEIVDGVRDFRMMTRQMVNSIINVPEYNRFSKGIFAWVGFKTKYIEFENQERVAGETKWSFWSLFKYAIEGIVSFTTAPLKIAAFVGLVTSFISVILLIITLIKGSSNGLLINTSLLIEVILLVGGILLLSIGIIGEYLSKVYMEVKNRPLYIVKKKY